MSELTSQIRLVVRRLRRAPSFSAIAVLTLALGIGANTAIFSIVDGVLVKPLPYPDPEQLVGVWHAAPGFTSERMRLSLGAYFTYRPESRLLDDLGLVVDDQVTIMGEGAEPERVAAVSVTDGTLPLLGAAPVSGRLFSRADDTPGAPLTAILSHGYWQRRFGGRADALGQTLVVDGRPREIVGVLARGFQILQFPADVYLPAQFDPAHAFMGDFSYLGIGRLRPGVTISQLDQEIDRLIPVAVERFPGGVTLAQISSLGFRAAVAPLKAEVVGDVGLLLWVLLGTVGIVLLLACSNVANLFMVQAEGRQREVAVRTALGASRGRIVGGFVVESLVLGGLGGIAAVGLAFAGLRVLLALGPDLPRAESIGIDGRVLAFTALVSLLAALLFGLAPALRFGRPDLIAGLKEGGRGSSGGRERHRVRNGLIVVQVALALVLLVGAGLMLRSVRSLRHVDPGFARPEEVVTFRIDIPAAEIGDPAGVAATERAILDRLRQLPGVTAMGAASTIAMTEVMGNGNPIVVEGRPVDPGVIPPIRRYVFTAPGYWETLLIPLVAGRTLTWNDVETRAPVVVVSENLAREEWGDPANALGKRIRDFLGSPRWAEVVGVVADVRELGVTQPAPTTVYWPLAISQFWDQSLFVPRAIDLAVRVPASQVRAIVPQIRNAVWEVNRHLALAGIRTLDDLLARSMARASFAMVMLAIAAAVALGLGLVGIYGVISYIVTQRTREIGVRIALGARPADVRRMVVRQASQVAGIGLGAGLLGALALSRLMGSLLYGVRPFDPLTYFSVAAIIAGVVLLASYLPARRAAGIDPVTALRAE
jgi:putative ABC transport system permease protein